MARTKSDQATARQVHILRTLLSLARQGRPPVISELVQELGLAGSSSLVRTLQTIERHGLIEITGGGKRGKRQILNLTNSGKVAAGQLGIPLLGDIPAGPLQESLDHAETRIEVPGLLDYEEGDFLLNVKGESMIGDGILDGDLVLLRPNIDVNQGEIAAVQVGPEYLGTLKRVYLDVERRQVTLRASNPDYKDLIVPSDQICLVGVFRGLVRTPRPYRGGVYLGT